MAPKSPYPEVRARYARRTMPGAHFEESRPDFAPYGFTCEIWDAHPMRRADRHNELELNLVESGSLTYLLGGRRVTLRARHLSAFWAATPHQVLRSRDVSFYYVVTVPLAWVLGWGLPEPFVQRLLGGAVVEEPEDGRAELDMMRCAQWHADLSPGQEGGEEVVLLEVKARLLRLAASTRAATRGSGSQRVLSSAGEAGPTNVEQMAGFIARHYREPIGLDDVARAIGLNPDYAATLCRKTFGVTPTRLVLQHRIMHAQRELVTSDAKILKVALDAGFGSLSRFNTAFRAVCGCSPREYRRMHRI
jgi:AraC family transcriptional regulator, melibiose operon regulatory protein